MDSIAEVLSVADSIVSALGGEGNAKYKKWLELSVGQLEPKAKGRVILDVLRELSQRGVIVATTNYDGLLSRHLDMPPLSWGDYAQSCQ